MPKDTESVKKEREKKKSIAFLYTCKGQMRSKFFFQSLITSKAIII